MSCFNFAAATLRWRVRRLRGHWEHDVRERGKCIEHGEIIVRRQGKLWGESSQRDYICLMHKTPRRFTTQPEKDSTSFVTKQQHEIHKTMPQFKTFWWAIRGAPLPVNLFWRKCPRIKVRKAWKRRRNDKKSRLKWKTTDGHCRATAERPQDKGNNVTYFWRTFSPLRLNITCKTFQNTLCCFFGLDTSFKRHLRRFVSRHFQIPGSSLLMRW